MIREVDLVDDWSLDGCGWARFDATRKQRFRLARAVSAHAKQLVTTYAIGESRESVGSWIDSPFLTRVVFVLLNPSTADAFEDDRTVSKCMRFAELWGFDVVEIVNLFSIRTPYPEDVKQATDRGDGPTNDLQILAALRRPNVKRVVAGWGKGAAIDLIRTEYVTGILQAAREMHGFELLALKKLSNGAPIHPLSRGKEYIPFTIEPVRWP